MKNKKGQISGLQEIITTLIIVGILVGVAFVVLGSLRTNMSTTSNIVYDETITPTTSGVYLLNNQTSVKCFSNVVIVNATNQSGSFVIQPGNYTVNPTTGLFRNISGANRYMGAWNISYTYNSGDEACQGVVDTMNATKNVPAFLPILVIIGIVGILLAIVFTILPKMGNKETAYV